MLKTSGRKWLGIEGVIREVAEASEDGDDTFLDRGTIGAGTCMEGR